MSSSLRLLAGPSFITDGQRRAPPVGRPLLLLSYLAYQEDWVSRDELLVLFWPEATETKARQSLRALLYQAKNEPYAGALEVEGARVRWPVATDLQAFREAVASGDWRGAVASYGGTFLARVQSDASAAFEAWLEATRDELHSAWRDAALHVADELSRRKQHSDAAKLLQEVLNYDFLDEGVVRACMAALARGGRQKEALSIFETFDNNLSLELDMHPLETTRELADLIRREALVTAAPPQAALPITTPQPLTPFVGRTLELLELGNLLAEPHTRLVTLLGPGGVGKSRLSLALIEQHKAGYQDGAVFIALAGLNAAADVPGASASALGLELSGERPVAEEVCDYLRDKTTLLVFDNVEHVLEGAPFIARLLAAAPGCRLVATSRVVLGLPNETVYDVAGLTVPFSARDGDIESYDAAQLFLRSARRARSDFKVEKQDHAELFALCKRLDGMPLALELAASWVRLFGLGDLLSELERDSDLLEAAGQEVSERHQSLRAVFEQSWRLLTPEEGRVLAALSVFYGSFDRQAAATVTGASARTLLALVNKSLLRSAASGRFSLLLVIRQYAAEKLRDETYREQHAHYYLGVLTQARGALGGAAPKPTLAQLEQELDNLRAAWAWALGAGRYDLCLDALEPLSAFLTGRARFQEGLALFEHALSVAGESADNSFRAHIHVALAYFHRRLDQHARAGRYARAALRLAPGASELAPLRVRCLCELAIVHCWQGDFGSSLSYAEQALALAEALQVPELVVDSTSRLALVKRMLGVYDEALVLYGAVLKAQRASGRQMEVLRTLSDLGRLYVNMDRPHEARALFAEGLVRAQQQDMPYELGFMWEGLSQCSYLLGDYDAARQEAETALAKSEAVNDQMGVAIQCADLAKILLEQGQAHEAQGYLKRALGIAWDKGEVPEVMKHFVTWARLAQAHDPGRARALLHWVVRHPGAQASSKQEARALLGALGAEPRRGVLEDAFGPHAAFKAPATSLDDVVCSLLEPSG